MLHNKAKNGIIQYYFYYRVWFEKSLGSGDPIILYLHGNTGSRAREHRLGLYRVLQKLNYHVICFDYRGLNEKTKSLALFSGTLDQIEFLNLGYADSSPVMPTKTGVVTDALSVYEYVKKHSKNSTVIVYGHSLGTAVSCEAVSILCGGNNAPNALILESPFNNIHEEVRLKKFFYRQPDYNFMFLS